MGNGKTIAEKIRDGEVNFEAKAPKPKKAGIIKRILKWPFEIALAMIGLDIDKIGKGNVSATNYQNNMIPPHPRNDFRDDYRVPQSPLSPYSFNPIEAESLTRYIRSSDGKGDPEPCDCDHDR